MEIKDIPTADIVPYPSNPRHIPDSAVKAVADSIAEYGWQQPIVLDVEGVVIAGHTRLAAAQRLALDTVPCYVAEHLSPEQAAAYRLADNRTGEISSWDLDALTAEIDALAKEAMSVDFSIPGFDAKEVSAMLELAAPAIAEPPPLPPARAPLPRAEIAEAPHSGRVYSPEAPQGPLPEPDFWYLDNSLVSRAYMCYHR